MKQRLLNPQAARRVIAGLLLLFMVLQVAQGQDIEENWSKLAATVIENKGGGNGLKENPIFINSAEELAYLAKTVNEEGTLNVNGMDGINGNNGFKDIYFALSNDIDLKQYHWTPIGIHPDNKFFRGHFDGKGHCISGLSVGYGSDQYSYAGLFGYVKYGTIQNLGVSLAENGGIWGTYAAGGIAGYIESSPKISATLRNCYVEGPGKVISKGDNNNYAGGIAGNTVGTSTTLSHCYATVDVEASGVDANYAGGIVGYGSGNISNTYATGSIQALGNSNNRAGGICGIVNLSTTLSNNLALNKEIKGDGEYIHRVAGYASTTNSILTSNYASPETYVNGKPVSSQEADGFDGSDEDIDLTNYAATLKKGDANEWSDAWNFDNNSLLPQLRIVESENEQGSPTEYSDWTNSPQPDLQAANYLIAIKIVNEGGDDESGKSWVNPIRIANRAELAYLARQVNAGKNITVGNTSMDHKGKYFILTDNIDLSAYHWVPIGEHTNYFVGHFDGKGYCIEGLTVGSESNKYQYAGLFGYVLNGTIQNLGVRLAKDGIWGSEYAGGIVGCINASSSTTSATLRNCYVEGPGKVMSKGDKNNFAGGIAGTTVGKNTTLSHCYATVDVEASGGSNTNRAGGIVGYGSGNISYTYATGSIQASEKGDNWAGGICGIVNNETTLSNNLALNKEIKGDGENIHRVAGSVSWESSLANNYASLQIPVNSASVYNQDLTSLDGSDDIHINDYEKALNTDKQPWVFGGTNHLPKLRMLISNDPDNPKYETLLIDNQPTLSPADYLPAKFILHIVTPIGGSVTVKDGANNEIQDNVDVIAGTPLVLLYNESTDYEFVHFLSGTSQENLSNCDATLTMPKSELWVSAQFNKKPEQETPDPEPETPDPPYVPIYYTVTLPSVEGATTDPAPGDYEVESWNTFRFYLMPDSAYSDSQPLVTTSRGETLTSRTSDGAYLVKYVRTDVEVFIDGILPNNPTANAAIEADALRIYALGSTLMISAPRTAEAMLCDLSGRLLHTYNISPGLNRIEGIRAGIYIVKVPGFEGVKVMIR